MLSRSVPVLASVILCLGASLWVGACSSEEEEQPTTSSTSGTGGGGGGGGMAGMGGAGGATPDACGELGLPVRAFVDEGGGTTYGDLATDFTVQTLDGPWSFSEGWSGCETYVFLNHFDSTTGNSLWGSDAAELLSASARNVHYFFGAYAEPGMRDPMLQQMRGKVDTALAAMAPEDATWWASRVHYVTDDPAAIVGSLGGLYQEYYPSVLFGVAIDRYQRFDAAGSLQAFIGSGFSGRLRTAGYLGRHYNFVYERNEAVAAETDVTVVPMLTDQLVTENNQLYPVPFPDAATMAAFDHMVIDVELSCGPGPTDCGEWDYEAFLELCDDQACTGRDQIGLWITPYSRPGTRRWLIEATPFLSMLQDGGERFVRFGMLWNMNPNTMNVSFRLRTTGAAAAPRDFVPLFTGGTFDATYNDNYQPISFTPPSATTKVELVAILTGHGQEASNCAEWCNHEHEFTVNGTAVHTKSHPEAGTGWGCAEMVDEGVIPGQYGNWAPGRAAWCPGLAVQPWIVDITDDVTIGAENQITYQGLYNGGTPVGGRIRLSSYLVYSE
ncbi:MAG: hypothetical protein JRI68_06360 [Deltaproteobacteria bacterium]|nr:hypothetical protein [Deltaproteobacteria bacterium]